MEEYVVNIPWSDGTEDYFSLVLKEDQTEGDEAIITITSQENNTGVTRSKILRFRSTVASQADAVLNVQQQADNLVIATFEQVYSVYGNNQVKAGFNLPQ